jgi:hypothetical protein
MIRPTDKRMSMNSVSPFGLVALVGRLERWLDCELSLVLFRIER